MCMSLVRKGNYLYWAILLMISSILFVPSSGQDQQYTNVPDDVIKKLDTAIVQATLIRDYALLSLSSLSVQDAQKNIEQALNLLEKERVNGVLKLTQDVQTVAQDKRWTKVSFALNNVYAFYDISSRKSAQTALDLGKRSGNPSTALTTDMKNAIRELFAYATAALGATEDAITSVTAGGLRTIRDFLKRQKS